MQTRLTSTTKPGASLTRISVECDEAANEVGASRAAGATDAAPSAAPAKATPRKIIQARSGWQAVNLREMWRYRELLFFMVWRDVKIRYKQTVLGAAWAIIQPVMTMVVFDIFFGRLGGMAKQVEGSYSVFIYAALLPWTFFSVSVNQASMSLLNNAHLLAKVYFPRLLIPLAAIGGGLVDFAISFGVMLLLMLVSGVGISSHFVLLPLFVAGTVLTTLAVAIPMSAVVVAYRDFRYIIAFAVQLWMFASPVAYPLEVVPAEWRFWYSLNPMVGMISGFRSTLLGETFHWDCIGISLAVTLVTLVIGAMFFRRVERSLADII